MTRAHEKTNIQSKRRGSLTRPLGPTDRYFFDNSFAPINGIFSFSTKGLMGVSRSHSKMKKAFEKVVKDSPILQTEVVGDGEEAVFSKISSEDYEKKIPSLVIEQDEKTTVAMMKKARSVRDDILAKFAMEGQVAHRKSARLHAVRGPEHITFIWVAPHHFVDGVGISSVVTQMYVRQLLPKALWCFFRPGSKELPPSYMEMGLKSDFMGDDVVVDPQSEGFLSRKSAPDNFYFEHFDPLAPGASSDLHGIKETISRVSTTSVRKCCQSLRKQGISLTSAFSALSIKLLAKFLAENNTEASMIPHDKCLLATNGVDARSLGKWGKKSDRKFVKLPIVGNYAFQSSTQVPFDDALSSSLEEVALVIKKNFDRIRYDATFRHHEMTPSTTPASPSRPFCGVSSVVFPHIMQKLKIRISVSDPYVEFGTVPHVWFYVITNGAETAITADINLPIPHLTEENIRVAIKDISHGTSLGPLLEKI